MRHFYISFATDEAFLGATVVRGIDAQDALVDASFRGMNLGGEALILEVPADDPDMQAMLNRLVTREEIVSHGGKRLGDLPAGEQDGVVGTAAFVCAEHNKP
ncbi:hypothetical protein [Bradyrhizobium elkanii]|uniref:hypothetical protein n=1 Tax=Bradyrhizobium elkanii TaxID=29448 RepID=UPI0008419194|nr:hypothetical protein [Bradyrhizobium elkanii]ODM71736.1 hypothetical protein A6X20_07280 [Bradyrhizobium elkanii]ODM79109.1 hypothetical protein A6452_28865 [Bradyrhizobium elkanii]